MTVGLNESEIDAYNEVGTERFGTEGWAIARRLLLSDTRWAKAMPTEHVLVLLTPASLRLLGQLLDAGFDCIPVHEPSADQISWAERDEVCLAVMGGAAPKVELPRPPQGLETVWSSLACRGIGVPPIPRPIQDRGRWVGEGSVRWTTMPDGVDQPDGLADYMMDDPSYVLGAIPDHLTMTSDGRGFTVRAAFGAIAVHAQVLYGGEPPSWAITAGRITTLLHRVAELLTAAGEPSWNDSRRARNAVLRWSEERGISELSTWNHQLREWDAVPFNGRQHADLFDQTVTYLRSR